MSNRILSFSGVIECIFERPYWSTDKQIEDGTKKILDRLKQELIDNYKANGNKNCIGSVEKVVNELFKDIKL